MLLQASLVVGKPSATQVYREMWTPSFWGSLETPEDFAFGHRRDTDTSLCFSKYLTRQNKLESPHGYFLPRCLQPQCPQACHSRTWRRRRWKQRGDFPRCCVPFQLFLTSLSAGGRERWLIFSVKNSLFLFLFHLPFDCYRVVLQTLAEQKECLKISVNKCFLSP